MILQCPHNQPFPQVGKRPANTNTDINMAVLFIAGPSGPGASKMPFSLHSTMSISKHLARLMIASVVGETSSTVRALGVAPQNAQTKPFP
jgi:hypothetical protein